jgi:hypothetical protein
VTLFHQSLFSVQRDGWDKLRQYFNELNSLNGKSWNCLDLKFCTLPTSLDMQHKNHSWNIWIGPSLIPSLQTYWRPWNRNNRRSQNLRMEQPYPYPFCAKYDEFVELNTSDSKLHMSWPICEILFSIPNIYIKISIRYWLHPVWCNQPMVQERRRDIIPGQCRKTIMSSSIIYIKPVTEATLSLLHNVAMIYNTHKNQLYCYYCEYLVQLCKI